MLVISNHVEYSSDHYKLIHEADTKHINMCKQGRLVMALIGSQWTKNKLQNGTSKGMNGDSSISNKLFTISQK